MDHQLAERLSAHCHDEDRRKSSEHVMPVLAELYWLPVTITVSFLDEFY